MRRQHGRNRSVVPSHGMVDESFTYRLSVRLRLEDRPGSLQRVTDVVAAAGVNIARVEVVSALGDEVWDDLELAAGSESALDVALAELRNAGFDAVRLPPDWTIRDWSFEVLEALEALSACRSSGDAQQVFADAAAALSRTQRGFVLMDQPSPNVLAARERWVLLRDAAMTFDPDDVEWSGSPEATAAVKAAMAPLRGSGEGGAVPSVPAVGAAVRCPIPGRPVAWLAVVGQRPPFLEPELARLEAFARVASPHLVLDRWEASA